MDIFSLLCLSMLAIAVAQNQSPIDIVTKNVQEIDLGPLTFDKGSSKSLGSRTTLKNDGQGFSITSDAIKGISVTGGGLFGKYKFALITFHWGGTGDKVEPKAKAKVNTGAKSKGKIKSKPKSKPKAKPLLRKGSTHTINGRQSPAEMHLVFYRNTYKNIAEAIKHGGYEALAIIAVLIEDQISVKTAPPKRKKTKSSKDETRQRKRVALFKKITNALNKIENPKQKTQIDLDSYDLEHLLPDDTRHFWSYEGSMTTPKYEEIVAWRIMEDYVVLPTATVTKLAETVKDAEKKVVKENYRKIQKTNGRQVYFHKEFQDWIKKPWPKEQCVIVHKTRTYDCAIDYVEAISKSFVEDCPIPSCLPDNSYSPTQCHKDECWCVRKDGKQIGSRMHYAKKNMLKCDSFKVRGEVSCEKMRQAAILKASKFTPKCNHDGSFRPKQCYTVKSPFMKRTFCWCSMKTGEKVPQTINAAGTPGAKRTNCKDIADTKNLCRGSKIGYHRHPDNCRFYVFCLFDSFRLCTCPKGMYFNVWKKKCEWKKKKNKC